MGYSVSPSVIVQEFDYTVVVPAVSTSIAALAGVFRWGPVEDRVLITDEDQLVSRFLTPNTSNFETFFTGANFLAYSNALYVSRAASNTAYNAVANTGATSNIQVKNAEDFEIKKSSLDANVAYLAKYPGDPGNSLRISQCDSASAFTSNVAAPDANNATTFSFNINSANLTLTVTNDTANVTLASNAASVILDTISVGDYVRAGNSTIGQQYLKVTGKLPVANVNTSTVTATLLLDQRYALSTAFTSNTLPRYWEFFNLVDRAPGTSTYTAARGGSGDELHVVVVDEDGKFTNTPNTVLEIYEGLSRARDAIADSGGSNYYKDVINLNSPYVWQINDRLGAVSNTAANITPQTNSIPLSLSFVAGTSPDDESTIAVAPLAKAADQFRPAEEIDISLIMQGKARGGVNGEQFANYIIDNITEYRKDCVAFISPDRPDVVGNFENPEEAVVAFNNSVRNSSYAFVDSGYKQQYDKYNDVYRYVPLNGDIAGLAARTDSERDPWWSFAGYNRGIIKNVVKLAFNPNKAQRDYLFKNNVNPVVTENGTGTVLLGDKTRLAKPSAFDAINVRRLFIVLEKAIATAAKYTLFEFNDSFTQAAFKNMIEPYLRDVKGRRGITDFRVVCDSRTNTPEVIDRNEFIAKIMIKPARAIRYITLQFMALRTGVEFEEYY